MATRAALTAVISLFAISLLAGHVGAQGADLFVPSWSAGKVADAERGLQPTAFYLTPESKARAQAGTLVRSAPAEDFELPPGVTATRFLYHTRTAHDLDTVASGVVLVPYGKPPKDGWPLLAWAHGTSGVARACAPSLMKSVYYNYEGLYEYVLAGYAVVATDYVGLGTEGRHAYIDILSNGSDVIYSVPAARAAVPNLGQKWIAVGHSQGGLAVQGVALLEDKIRDPNFLGTVSIAGASDVEWGVDSMIAAKQPVTNGLIAFIVFGAKSVYPELQPKDVLTDKARGQYDAFVEDGCRAASGAFAAIPSDQMLKPGWKDNRYLKQFLARNRPGAHRIYGPMLMVSGGADFIFTEAASGKILQRLCDEGAQVQRKVYPGLAHDPVVYGSLRDQLDWIAARFSGEAAPSSCRRSATR
jgi:pimeloyl-ACP methyl ester carboxylesterase